MSLTQPNPPALADRHLPSYDLIPNGHDEQEANDMEELSLEIEKERQYCYKYLLENNISLNFIKNVYRVQYLEKSKHLQNQLRDLKTEIEVLKVDEKQSELDMLHDEQVRLGENKYSTLKKVNNFVLLL